MPEYQPNTSKLDIWGVTEFTWMKKECHIFLLPWQNILNTKSSPLSIVNGKFKALNLIEVTNYTQQWMSFQNCWPSFRCEYTPRSNAMRHDGMLGFFRLL